MPVPPGTGIRVMCVDDFEDVVRTLLTLLELYGIQARGFLDGPSALAAVTEFDPHVCILDINMPVMDGYQLAKRLREIYGQKVKLIALSAAISDEFCDQALQCGFDLAVTKPPDMSELLKAIFNVAQPNGP